MRMNLCTAWLLAGAILGLGIKIFLMVCLASGIGVRFEISMLLEEFPLFLCGGLLLGLIGFGVNKAFLKAVQKQK